MTGAQTPQRQAECGKCHQKCDTCGRGSEVGEAPSAGVRRASSADKGPCYPCRGGWERWEGEAGSLCGRTPLVRLVRRASGKVDGRKKGGQVTKHLSSDAMRVKRGLDLNNYNHSHDHSMHISKVPGASLFTHQF